MSIVPSLAALVLATALALPAQAAIVYNTSEPISGTIVNPCNGEVVTYSGYIHDTYHLTFDNAGGVHIVFQDNAQGIHGVGDLGNAYTGTQAQHDSMNGNVGEEETATSTFTIISHGSAPNFVAHSDFHITVNADGTVTSYHDNMSATCQG